MTQANDMGRRTRVSRPYPIYTLEDALSIARAIQDVNAGLPFDRELLAGAIGTTPKSSTFITRLNASAWYGLTEGGYNDPDICLTLLGQAAVASESESERRRALTTAALNPDTLSGFYELFDGRHLPQSTYLYNILQRELGVRSDLVEECLAILLDNGEFAGIITSEDETYRVELPEPLDPVGSSALTDDADNRGVNDRQPADPATRLSNVQETDGQKRKAIFIGHIGDSDAVSYVSSMLDQFNIPSAATSIPEEDSGLLVPREVGSAMRKSYAAVLVFRSGDDSWSSRDRMIALIGAASVLFDDRVVILHEEGEQMSIKVDGMANIGFDIEKPGESGIKLLTALHKAGVLTIGV